MFKLNNTNCIGTKTETVCDMVVSLITILTHCSSVFLMFQVLEVHIFSSKNKKKKGFSSDCVNFPSKHAKIIKRKSRNNTHIKWLPDPKKKC